MPQMAPLMWLSLFILFSSTLILFSILNYFNFQPLTPSSASSTASITQHPLFWLW